MVCHYHTGTRYFVRGLDTDGNAANFVETEQMVWYNGQVASYVQVNPTLIPRLTTPLLVLPYQFRSSLCLISTPFHLVFPPFLLIISHRLVCNASYS